MAALTFFCLMFCLALDIFLKFRAMEPHTDPSRERKKVPNEQLVVLLLTVGQSLGFSELWVVVGGLVGGWWVV